MTNKQRSLITAVTAACMWVCLIAVGFTAIDAAFATFVIRVLALISLVLAVVHGAEYQRQRRIARGRRERWQAGKAAGSLSPEHPASLVESEIRTDPDKPWPTAIHESER